MGSRSPNYDNFTANSITYLYNHWEEYDIIYGETYFYGVTRRKAIHLISPSRVLTNEYDESTNINSFTASGRQVLNDGTILRNVDESLSYTFDLNTTASSEGSQRLLKSYDSENNFYIYNLKPHKLEIANNGIGSITNSVNTEPYVTSQIYYDGQPITLTYDNTNGDFKCWYDDNNQRILSRELSYTFNITEDTHITLLTNTGAIGELSRDSEFKRILYPKTKVEAITNDDEEQLSDILNGKQPRNLYYVKTLLSTDWVLNETTNKYEQSIIVSGVTTTNNITINATDRANNILAIKYGLWGIEQSTDTLKFECYILPTENISINVEVKE